jgi:adenosylcobinamide-GDP ribazoletransferase
MPSWGKFSGSDATLHASLHYWPLIGMVIGAFASLTWWIAQCLWPVLIAALLSVVATVWWTKALNEHHWVNVCEALSRSADRQQALTELQTPQWGMTSILVLGTTLALKVCVLWAWPLDTLPALLLWMHTCSRLAPLFIMNSLAHVDGVDRIHANAFAHPISRKSLLVAVAFVLLLGWVLLHWLSLLVLMSGILGCLITLLGIGRWFDKRLGGYTWDCLGATQQLAEVLCGLGALAALEFLRKLAGMG